MQKRTIHFAPDREDAGICEATGFLTERPQRVNCAYCIDLMRGANVKAGLRTDGSAIAVAEVTR